MSPITHFLVGWSALERALPEKRDKALVALMGLAPDLDGLPIVIDFATRLLGLPETNLYQAYHRVYGHGLPAALVFALLAAALGSARLKVAMLAFVSVHLHFLCDLLGSRGNGPDDLWGIAYFSPFSAAHEIVWSGQWPLVGWQNMLITALLLGLVLRRALRHGYSPLAPFAPRADAQLVATLRQRFAPPPPR